MMCEGFDAEDVLALDAAGIQEYGFIVVGVSDDSDDVLPWAYTVGMLEETGHPELIMAGPQVESAAALLNEMGRQVLEGARFSVGDTFRSRTGLARVGAVHPVQYELSTFATWHGLRAHGHLEGDTLEALQVFAPTGWFCECHAYIEPMLDDPGARVGLPLPRPNRAARRAKRRRSA